MGIDVDLWVIARSDVALEVARPKGRYLPQEPEQKAALLLSHLRPSGGSTRDRIGSTYMKSTLVGELEGPLDEFAATILQGGEDRLLVFESADGEYGVTAWVRPGAHEPVARATFGLDWSEMPETFVPDEPAVSCAVFTDGNTESVDIRLARAIDTRFKHGLCDCVKGGGIFFWDQELAGLKGVAVATQKFLIAKSHRAFVVIAYQTAIEGCFAWLCSHVWRWPKHVRLPVSLSNAPGDLLR